jgi:hypothetical protein
MPLMQGEQIWILIRTDRDGASAAEIAASIGDFMRWVLRNAKVTATGITDLQQVISTGTNEWRVGAARPVAMISVEKTRPNYPAGQTIASRETYPGMGIPTVAGQQPWWVTIRFWWRAATTTIEWPSLVARVGSLTGFNLADYSIDQADWTLDRAIVPAQPVADPGDATWAAAQGTRVEEVASNILSAGPKVVGALALVGIVYLFLRSRSRR